MLNVELECLQLQMGWYAMSVGLPMFHRLQGILSVVIQATISCIEGWKISDGGFIGGGVYALPESAFSDCDTQMIQYRNIIVDYMNDNGIQTSRGGWLCCQANFPSRKSGFSPELIWFARWLPINDGGGLIVATPGKDRVYENVEEAEVHK